MQILGLQVRHSMLWLALQTRVFLASSWRPVYLIWTASRRLSRPAERLLLLYSGKTDSNRLT